MTTNHPITPPPELISGWLHEAADLHLPIPANLDYLATRAAQWGADQELEACCELLKADGYKALAHNLRAARRPKPPSLKEQALEDWDRIVVGKLCTDETCIRRALEALPND